MKIYGAIVHCRSSGFIEAFVLADSVEDLQEKLKKHLNKYQVLELIDKKIFYQLRGDGSTATSVILAELEI